MTHAYVFTVAVVAGLAVVGAACGAHETNGFADDQPTSSGLFEPGELNDIPLPGATAAFTVRRQAGDTVTQSFKVTGLTPADVIGFYQERLPTLGWQAVAAPAEDGADLWRDEWARDDRLLQVTAEPDVDDGKGDGRGAATSQLDLVLRAAHA